MQSPPDHSRHEASLHGPDLLGDIPRSGTKEGIPPLFIDVDVEPSRAWVVDPQKVEIKTLHEGLQRNLTGEDAVSVCRSRFHLNTAKIFVRREDPSDHSLSIRVGQRLWVYLKHLEDLRRNESEVDGVSLIFGKSVQLCDGESHYSTS